METITSVKNERVKAAAKLSSSAKARREQGLFVLEGLRLCMDVVRSGLRCAELFVSEEFCKSTKRSTRRWLPCPTKCSS